MNNYVHEHLEELHHRFLKNKKERIKTELDILYHEQILLTKSKPNENNKQRI